MGDVGWRGRAEGGWSWLDKGGVIFMFAFGP